MLTEMCEIDFLRQKFENVVKMLKKPECFLGLGCASEVNVWGCASELDMGCASESRTGYQEQPDCLTIIT